MLAKGKELNQGIVVLAFFGRNAQNIGCFGRYFAMDELHAVRLGEPIAVVETKTADGLHDSTAIGKEDPGCIRQPILSLPVDDDTQQLGSFRHSFQKGRKQLFPAALFLNFTKNAHHVLDLEPFLHADSLKKGSVPTKASLQLEEVRAAVVLVFKSHSSRSDEAGSSPHTLCLLKLTTHDRLDVSGAGHILKTLAQVGVNTGADRLCRLTAGIRFLFVERRYQQKLLCDQF